MTKGKFYTSLNEVEDLLKVANLLRQKGFKPIGEVSAEFKFSALRKTYFQTYKIGKINFDFDFLLQDESYLQFSHNDSNNPKYPLLRYAFFQNPQEFISYEDYLWQLNIEPEEAGDSFIEEYSQYLSEASINTEATTIRYDLDFSSHHPLIHATSHLHIGVSENLRIPCNKIMTPVAFTLFIIKNLYYNTWKNLMDDTDHFYQPYLSNMKESCGYVMPPLWIHDQESKEFFLG